MLVIKVWHEGGPGAGFRARITTVADLADPAESVTTTSDPATVLRCVEQWLTDQTQR